MVLSAQLQQQFVCKPTRMGMQQHWSASRCCLNVHNKLRVDVCEEEGVVLMVYNIHMRRPRIA